MDQYSKAADKTLADAAKSLKINTMLKPDDTGFGRKYGFSLVDEE